MEVCNPKGGRTAAPAFPAMLLLMMMIMMLLNAYCCGAAVLANSNTSFRCSDGRLDECLIEEDLELELRFLINPYVSRILTDGTSSGGVNSKDPSKPAVSCGGTHDTYSKCISEKVDPNNHPCKAGNIYNRCSPKPKPSSK